MNQPLWQPSDDRIAAANLTRFAAKLATEHGARLSGYAEIYDWSVAEMEKFWPSLWDFCGVIGERGARVLADGDKMPGARFFPDAQGELRREPAAPPGSGRPRSSSGARTR